MIRGKLRISLMTGMTSIMTSITASVIASGVLVVGLGACSTTSRFGEIFQPAKGTGPSIPQNYEEKIEQYSAGDQEYAGLYNNFEFKATLINAPIRDALVDRQADYYKWDDARRSAERAKRVETALTETNVYLSFFTPNNKNDNLDDAKKIWEIYLTVGGQRYSGVAKRNKMNRSELLALYPYSNAWGTNYDLTFPVSVSTIETQNSELTITGPLGARSITFPAVR